MGTRLAVAALLSAALLSGCGKPPEWTRPTCASERIVLLDPNGNDVDRENAAMFLADSQCTEPESVQAMETALTAATNPITYQFLAACLARYSSTPGYVREQLKAGRLSAEDRLKLAYCLTYSTDPVTLEDASVLAKDVSPQVRLAAYEDLYWIPSAKSALLVRRLVAAESDPGVRKGFGKWKHGVDEDRLAASKLKHRRQLPPFGPVPGSNTVEQGRS